MGGARGENGARRLGATNKAGRSLRVDTRVGDNPETDRAADMMRIGDSISVVVMASVADTRHKEPNSTY